MSYQQCTRFRTTLDSDDEYLWNGSSNRQAENGAVNYDFFSHVMKTIWWTWSTNQKNDIDLCATTLRLKRVHAVVKEHVCAKFHPAKYSGSWVIVRTSFFALSRNGEKSGKNGLVISSLRHCETNIVTIIVQIFSEVVSLLRCRALESCLCPCAMSIDFLLYCIVL